MTNRSFGLNMFRWTIRVLFGFIYFLQHDNYDPIGLATDSGDVFCFITYLKAAANTIVPRSPFWLFIPKSIDTSIK